MARLSKADWNKLKKVMGVNKGELLRPSKAVKWTTGKNRKAWGRQATLSIKEKSSDV